MHARNLNVGTVEPGAVQPGGLQFPTTQDVGEAALSATLSTTSFTVGGQNYVASSGLLAADLLPAAPGNLVAGSDFAVLTIDATIAPVNPVPEPNGLYLAAVGSLLMIAAFAGKLLKERRQRNGRA